MDIDLRNLSQPLGATKTIEAQLWRHPLREWCSSLEIVFKGILHISFFHNIKFVKIHVLKLYLRDISSHTSKKNFIKYMSCNKNQKKKKC